MLTDEQKRKLLEVARDSIEQSVKGNPLPRLKMEDEALTAPGAAFVTIHREGELRGCIGLMESTHPLCTTVARMARAAALEDPRFPPVTEDELNLIRLEISVLSPLDAVSGIEEIEIGKHGLKIQQGYRSGVLLPQVATEYGWDAVQFVRQTCRKAGLPSDAWENGAELRKFSAEVFGEEIEPEP